MVAELTQFSIAEASNMLRPRRVSPSGADGGNACADRGNRTRCPGLRAGVGRARAARRRTTSTANSHRDAGEVRYTASRWG